jgi:hypothetical protein
MRDEGARVAPVHPQPSMPWLAATLRRVAIWGRRAPDQPRRFPRRRPSRAIRLDGEQLRGQGMPATFPPTFSTPHRES